MSVIFNAIGEFLLVKVNAFVGGPAIENEIEILSKGVHVIVATPGRFLDLIK